MSFARIREVVTEQLPSLGDDAYWDLFDAALVVAFTGNNTTDLHKSVRDQLGLNPGSHKTHVDITSGGDIPEGLSPVSDFFDLTPEQGTVGRFVRMNRENLLKLGAKPGGVGPWIGGEVHLTALEPRNVSGNPSAQLLQYDDLLPIREKVEVGQSIVFLRRKTGDLDALAIESTPGIREILSGKTKRMFLNDSVGITSEAVLVGDAWDTPEPAPGEKTGDLPPSRPGRTSDPRLRKAIEERGMEVVRTAAEAHGLTAQDVHRPNLAVDAGLAAHPGYDIRVSSGDDEAVGIEVKATMSLGHVIQISSNELLTAVENPAVFLAVVHSVELNDADGNLTGANGQLRLFRWTNREVLGEFLEGIDELLGSQHDAGLVGASFNVQLDTRKAFTEEVGFEELVGTLIQTPEATAE